MENLKTNYENSNFSEEIISEKDLPTYLCSLEAQALIYIQNSDISTALSMLKRSEEIMESITAQGGMLSSNLVISILYNIAYCYQETQDVKKLITYMDACYFNVNKLEFIQGKQSSTETRILKHKFAAKVALQCSSILFSVGQKKKSLKFASAAFKNSSKALQETLEICKKQHFIIQSKPKHTKLTKSEKNKMLLIERALPTLETLNFYLSKGVLHKVEMRSALGVKGDPNWVELFNVTELLMLGPIRSNEILQGMGIQAEFSKDYLFYKISLLAISMSTLGIRNVQLGNKEIGQKICQSAQRLLRSFFSDDCRILQQINAYCEDVAKDSEQSPPRNRKIKRNKSLSFNLGKYNMNSSSFSKFRSIYERQDGVAKSGSKKKVKRNVSLTPNVFRELKKKNVSSELKLNVE